MKETLQNRRMKFEARHPEWGELSIFEEFLRCVNENPEREFIIYDETIITYKEAYRQCARLTSVLRRDGIMAGSHTAVCIDNSLWFGLICLSLFQIGAIKISIGTKLKEKEVQYILKQSDTQFFICETNLTEESKNNLHNMKQVFTLTALREQMKADEENGVKPDLVRAERSITDPADILYTSGSTGYPKGVLLTQEILLQSAYANDYNRGFEEGRKIYIPLPMNHVFGYIEGMLGLLLVGGTMVFRSGKFSPKKALQCLEETRANDILLVPSMAVKMLEEEAFDSYDLSALYAMYCGASICTEKLWREIREEFRIEEIVTGYGMTELGGATMQNDPEDGTEYLNWSLGKCLRYRPIQGKTDWIEYKIINPLTGQEVPRGETGNVLCRGRLALNGYYNNPQANAAAYDADGWMITGDIGAIGEDGYFRFAGRSHEQYKINGENVSTIYLDRIIGESPDVEAVEVVGVPDDRTGYAGMAFIELVHDSAENRTKVMEYCRENLAGFQVPKYYSFGKREEWPQTASVKVQKYQLSKMAEEILRKGKCYERN